MVDIDVYRQGAAMLLAHPEQLYSVAFPTADSALPFTYPPFGAFVLMPLTLLPQLVAEVGMSLATTAALWWSLRIVCPPNTPPNYLILATAGALVLEPVTSTISFGQINVLLMALVVTDCLGRKTLLPRGVLTGIAAAIKLTPAVFVLFFLTRRNPRAAGWMIASCCLAWGVTAMFWPQASWQYFTHTLWQPGRIGEFSDATNVSIMAIATRAGMAAVWLWAVALLGVVTLWAAWRTRIDAAALLIIACFGLAASPISWSHHWVWLVLGIAVLHGTKAQWWSWWAIAAMTIGQFHKWLPWGDWSLPENLLAAHYLFLGLGAFFATQRFGATTLKHQTLSC